MTIKVYAPRPMLTVMAALGCFMGCGGAAKHVAAPSEGWEADDESTPLHKADLSHDARVRFDEQKVTVVDGDSGPTSYAFQDGNGELSQDEFVERYREVTGRTDLDHATSSNAGTASIVGGSLMMGIGAVGGIVLIVLSLQKNQPCVPMVMISNQDPTAMPMVQGCENKGPSIDPAVEVVGVIGSTLLGGAGALLLHSGLDSSRAHELSRDDAEYYAREYNRALLRKALRSPDGT